MSGLVASLHGLAITAALEMPVALELGAGWDGRHSCGDILASCAAVALHECPGSGIGDALVAHRFEQPAKQGGIVVALDRIDYPGVG